MIAWGRTSGRNGNTGKLYSSRLSNACLTPSGPFFTSLVFCNASRLSSAHASNNARTGPDRSVSIDASGALPLTAAKSEECEGMERGGGEGNSCSIARGVVARFWKAGRVEAAFWRVRTLNPYSGICFNAAFSSSELSTEFQLVIGDLATARS